MNNVIKEIGSPEGDEFLLDYLKEIGLTQFDDIFPIINAGLIELSNSKQGEEEKNRIANIFKNTWRSFGDYLVIKEG